MLKIVTVIGARPQIIKAAALSRAIQKSFSNQILEIILHTGQHYDHNMSNVFFEELGIPSPDYNLGVGSASHGVQTAEMMKGIESVLLKEKPACLVLYGDTNSTLAGAVAASKLHIPVAHIEAGLRSFNKAMPEEINRIVCDHCSTLLFSPTFSGVTNLIREGFRPNNKPPFTADNPGIFHCGDVMYDNTLCFSEAARLKTRIISQQNLHPNQFVLATIHRPANTDDPHRLEAILSALNRIAETSDMHVVVPLHPRTAKIAAQLPGNSIFEKLTNNPKVRIIAPASFLEMTVLEANAAIIITDSGGVQKEAYFFGKPSVILRRETEWIEIVENNCAILADADPDEIFKAFHYFASNPPKKYLPLFGDGHAAEFICSELIRNFAR